MCWFPLLSPPTHSSQLDLAVYVFSLSLCLSLFFLREIKRGRETSISCLSYAPRLGTEPATQACALTENWIGGLSLCGMMPNSAEPCRPGLSSLVLSFSVFFILMLQIEDTELQRVHTPPSSIQQGLANHIGHCLRNLLLLMMVLEWPILIESHWLVFQIPTWRGYHYLIMNMWHQGLSGKDRSTKWSRVWTLESGYVVSILAPPFRWASSWSFLTLHFFICAMRIHKSTKELS